MNRFTWIFSQIFWVPATKTALLRILPCICGRWKHKNVNKKGTQVIRGNRQKGKLDAEERWSGSHACSPNWQKQSEYKLSYPLHPCLPLVMVYFCEWYNSRGKCPHGPAAIYGYKDGQNLVTGGNKQTDLRVTYHIPGHPLMQKWHDHTTSHFAFSPCT